MFAMLFTAFSYGRMARAYPSAGSAFTYVGQEINPALGLRHGLEHGDGLHAQPDDLHHLVSQQAYVFAPGMPYWAWALFFAAVFTFLNLQGVKTSARVIRSTGGGDGSCDRDLFRGGDALHFRTCSRPAPSFLVPFTILNLEH